MKISHLSDLMRFFIIRLVILSCVAILIIIITQRQSTIATIIFFLSGVVLSAIRISILEGILKRLTNICTKKQLVLQSVLWYILSLLAIALILVMSVRISIATMICALIGALSLVIITIFNTITELAGVTHNGFGSKL